jgi:hypothetical protein
VEVWNQNAAFVVSNIVGRSINNVKCLLQVLLFAQNQAGETAETNCCQKREQKQLRYFTTILLVKCLFVSLIHLIIIVFFRNCIELNLGFVPHIEAEASGGTKTEPDKNDTAPSQTLMIK